MNSRLSTPESNALSIICREWYISFGALTLVVVLSFWVHPLWMPLYELLIAVGLALFGPGRKIAPGLPCGRITLITVYTLLFTALISFGINVAYHTEFIHFFFDISTLNHSIPYITSLVLFPVCLVLTLFLNSKYIYAHHVRNCHLHNQYNPTQPFFGRMVHTTYRSLLNKLSVMVAIVSVIDWGYYFLCYRNNRINTPDSFFFFVIPAAIYVWSIVYVRQSYSTLRMGNGRVIKASSSTADEQTHNVLSDSVVVRYLVIKNGELLLDISEAAIADCCVDTPLVEIKPDSFRGNVESARSDFEHRTGVSRLRIKLLYSNHDRIYNNTIYHYLVSIDEDADTTLLPGQWVGLDGIDRMMRMGMLSPQLGDEFFRIYTISMAWKTYDRKGLRKYPIRNYHPNFRLTDLYDYDVDFTDDHWLRVARFNQDNRFWPLTRFRL